MNLVEKRQQLEKELEEVNRQINQCQHDFEETKYDPEIIMEPYDYIMSGTGSDVKMTPQNFRKVKLDRWSQTCKKCGIKRYIEKVVATGYKPNFD